MARIYKQNKTTAAHGETKPEIKTTGSSINTFYRLGRKNHSIYRKPRRRRTKSLSGKRPVRGKPTYGLYCGVQKPDAKER